MKNPLHFATTSLGLLALLALLAATAAAQSYSLTYEGSMRIGGRLQFVRLNLDRERLIEWHEGSKRVVGWRYSGSCSDTTTRWSVQAISDSVADSPSYDYGYYDVSGRSAGPGSSIADSLSVDLLFRRDSLVGSLHGEFTPDGRFVGNWKSFDGDGGLIPFVLNRKSSIADEEDQIFYAADFPPFWNAFRDAIRRRDAAAMADMVQFPLRGPKCLAHALTLPANDKARVGPKDFANRFDRLFDSAATSGLVRIEPYEIETTVLFDSPYGVRSQVRKGALVYRVTLYPGAAEPAYSREFIFGRIDGAYKLMSVECASTEGC